MQDFFQNLSRFPRFLISITLGIFTVLFNRLSGLFKNPVTAIALSLLLVGGFAFLTLTLRAMLGLGSS